MISSSKLQAPVPEKSHLRQWRKQMLEEGIDPYSVVLALENVRLGEMLAELSSKFEFFRECPTSCDSISQSFEYWRSESQLWKDLTRAAVTVADDDWPVDIDPWGVVCEPVTQWNAWLQLSRKQQNRELNKISPTRWKAIFRYAQITIRKNLEDALHTAYCDDGTLDEIPLLTDNDLRLPAMLHLLTVYLPCCIHLKGRPEVLFKKAVKGDRHSLAAMIRLDPDVRRMPEFSGTIRKMLANEDRFVTRILTTPSRTTLKLDPASAKILAMHWIREHSRMIANSTRKLDSSQMRSVFGSNWKRSRMFSPQQLRELFDAKARDTRKLNDPHLSSIENGTLCKRMTRLLEKLPRDMWDIFSSANVPMN